MSTTGAAHDVVVLVRPGVLSMELGLIHQIFGRARLADGTFGYRVRTCALRPGRIATDADFAVGVDHGIEILETAGTVVVPASYAADEEPGVLDGGLREALTGLPSSTRIASICTAAFVLAEAGLLDRQRATTHWMAFDHFRRRFPDVVLDPDALFTDNGRVLTSGGDACGIDMCLHLVRRDLGSAVANEVARRTIVPPFRRGGQTQYIPRAAPGTDRAPAVTELREHLLADLARPVTLADLAERAGVSVRTLSRRFRDEIGMSPLEWMLRQRVAVARELLETTDLPVEQIAGRCGFGSGAGLRRHFTDAVGVSPRSYRSTFRGP
ncbi:MULTISPECIES: helix-turn-helix domain-containing protein [unclassified Pseudonocardia]|uniref:GlxA family transcriptional regulator n=1 Tax=unclassified Pseudonocardia TaxID=2619320 RepID=UPI0001FFE40B|nr:helix-turn-helix domain-containing protein [Pseudonocardia sp. Ae707_Ps1]OLM18574.1 Transcriptional regulator, AraC family [Pseudonocardia sp. Ae707_Ps1]